MPTPYETYRRVSIGELSWLGRLYYVLLAIVLGAVLPWMLFSHGHLKTITLDTSLFVSGGNAANPSLMQCPQDAPVPLPTEEGAKRNQAGVEGCVEWDWLELIETSASHAFLVTHVDERVERRACPRTHVRCQSVPLWEPVRNASFVIAGPEFVNVAIEHRVDGLPAAGGFASLGTAKHPIDGLLLPHAPFCVDEGKWRKSFAGSEGASPPLLALSNGRDVIPVVDLLRATGFEIDQILTPENRRRGVHIDLHLRYGNLWSDDASGEPNSSWFNGILRWLPYPGHLRYTYCAHFRRSFGGARTIVSAESSRVFPDPSNGDHSHEYRVVKEFHGVMIHIRTGDSRIHVVDGGTAIAFIAAACSLLSLPYLITETLLTIFVSLKPGNSWVRRLTVATQGE